MSILFSAGLLLLSIFIAWAGGALFVRGIDAFPKIFRLSGLITGLLIASISTSSPELFVGVTSAIKGIPEVSLGDILGSNIVNIGLILGIYLMFAPSSFSTKIIRTMDVLMVSGATILIFLLGFDGIISKTDGIILALSFALWIRWLIKEKRESREESEPEKKGSRGNNFLYFAIGIAMLIIAGNTFTQSAGDLANAFGVNLFLLSTIVVALGTSMPELATSIMAIRLKHNAIAVGNLLGSNVFNSLGILGIVAIIQPITITPSALLTPTLFGVLASLAVLLHKKLNRRIVGACLVAIYAFYILFDAVLWR